MPEYTALYRTWRPHRLADLVGQEHVARTLRSALRQGRVAHAYLFCGPRGTGKTSTARILAAALNCEGRGDDGDACGTCERCREVATDRLLDVREIDAASHRQVEDMRALRETVGYAPAAGRHKVYVLDEVHMLTDASWNTLLKTLEEPPPATTFILCTTEPRKVLPTVVSRCQRFDFRRLTEAEIVSHLTEVCAAERLDATTPALVAIARHADGGLRDALSILDQLTAYVDGVRVVTPADVAAVVGAAEDEALDEILSAVEEARIQDIFMAVERVYAAGKDMAQVARDIISRLRERVAQGWAAAAPSTGVDEPRLRWMLQAMEALAAAETQMRRWSQPRLALEVALLGLSAAHPAAGGERTVAGPTTPGVAAPAAGEGSRPVARPTSMGPADRSTGPAPRGPAAEDARRDDPIWPRVLEALRAENPLASGLLRDAAFRGCTDGIIALEFASAAQAAVAERWKSTVARLWRESGGPIARVEYTSPSERIGDGRQGAGGTRPNGPTSSASRAPGSAEPKRAAAARAASTPASRSARDPEAAFRRALVLFEGTALDGSADNR
jgi:DNA polymerase-3 subunit gamma/tau